MVESILNSVFTRGPLTMTDEQKEAKLLSDFRKINNRQQKNMLLAMASAAITFPREKSLRPRLSLVRTLVDVDLGKRAGIV